MFTRGTGAGQSTTVTRPAVILHVVRLMHTPPDLFCEVGFEIKNRVDHTFVATYVCNLPFSCYLGSAGHCPTKVGVGRPRSHRTHHTAIFHTSGDWRPVATGTP